MTAEEVNTSLNSRNIFFALEKELNISSMSIENKKDRSQKRKVFGEKKVTEKEYHGSSETMERIKTTNRFQQAFS
ncbi:CLUMA_CG018114, isoform A [Clunio marinus]|uniref:CLUMA_CG018114, isoform A n=1 Tax=Clunio marinus TaxID=568069 RepID=A0A1J1J184_9DIPT|nr:CLUMA_CG018114, isoform A [Clunio marinus]